MSWQLFPFLCGHRTDENDVRVGLFRLLSQSVPRRFVLSARSIPSGFRSSVAGTMVGDYNGIEREASIVS